MRNKNLCNPSRKDTAPYPLFLDTAPYHKFWKRFLTILRRYVGFILKRLLDNYIGNTYLIDTERIK